MAYYASAMGNPNLVVWEQSDVLCLVAATLGSLLWTAYANAKSLKAGGQLSSLEADAIQAGLSAAMDPPRQDRVTVVFAWILLLMIPLFIGFFFYWGFQNNLMERRYRYRNRVTLAQLLGFLLGLGALYHAHLSAVEEEERRRKRLLFKKNEGYYLHPVSLLLLPVGFLLLRLCKLRSLLPPALRGRAKKKSKTTPSHGNATQTGTSSHDATT